MAAVPRENAELHEEQYQGAVLLWIIPRCRLRSYNVPKTWTKIMLMVLPTKANVVTKAVLKIDFTVCIGVYLNRLKITKTKSNSEEGDDCKVDCQRCTVGLVETDTPPTPRCIICRDLRRMRLWKKSRCHSGSHSSKHHRHPWRIGIFMARLL